LTKHCRARFTDDENIGSVFQRRFCRKWSNEIGIDSDAKTDWCGFAAIPSGSAGVVGLLSGGVAALNNRLIAVTPLEYDIDDCRRG